MDLVELQLLMKTTPPARDFRDLCDIQAPGDAVGVARGLRALANWRPPTGLTAS